MAQRRPSHASLVRIALVTGANRGIGFEVCRQLAEKGFVVLLTARDAAKAQKAARKLADAGTVEALLLDVGDASSIKKAADDVASRYGYLDVLVNNAGINYDTWETAENADIDGTVAETISTNLLGPWRMCQAFLPRRLLFGIAGPAPPCPHTSPPNWRSSFPLRFRWDVGVSRKTLPKPCSSLPRMILHTSTPSN